MLSQVLDHTIYLAKHAFQHVTVKTNGAQRFCIAPLVIKAMHKAHAINILAREKLIEEAEIVLRILIEVSFVVGALAKERTFVSQYARSAYVQKKRELQSLLRGTAEMPTPILTADQVGKLKAQLTKLDESIHKLGAKPISIREYAEKSGMLAIYFINYSRLSSSVHSGPEDIDRFIKNDADRKLLSIGPPDPGRPDVLLWVAIETMIRILKAASDIFGLSIIGLNKVEDVYRGMSALMLTEMKII
ncbi:MAG: hypothetical protein QOG67_101 [Verrucomicrobiota bacterium]